jgi:hypothetical protein
VEWNFGSVEHHQQLGLVGVEPHEQAVDHAAGEPTLTDQGQAVLAALLLMPEDE